MFCLILKMEVAAGGFIPAIGDWHTKLCYMLVNPQMDLLGKCSWQCCAELVIVTTPLCSLDDCGMLYFMFVCVHVCVYVCVCL